MTTRPRDSKGAGHDHSRAMTTSSPAIDLAAEPCEATVRGLCRLLADTYTLALKTQNYHWNVTGPQFRSHHLLFEAQYDELLAAADVLAERIRALDSPAPASHREFLALTQIDEESDAPGATTMLRRLLFAHDLTMQSAQALLKVAEDAGDAPTADLATNRIRAHQHTAWLLRSHLAP